MLTNPPFKQEPHRPTVSGAAGFTLIELLIVVAIICALAAIAIPQYQGFANRAKITVATSTLHNVKLILADYVSNKNSYPATIDFTTGLDDQGQIIFQQLLRDQINKDLFPPSLSYVRHAPGDSYTLTAQANDQNHTVLILTQNSLTIQGYWYETI